MARNKCISNNYLSIVWFIANLEVPSAQEPPASCSPSALAQCLHTVSPVFVERMNNQETNMNEDLEMGRKRKTTLRSQESGATKDGAAGEKAQDS